MTTELEALKMQITDLSQAILEAHPRLPVLLREIHTALKKDPATVTLLDEDDIAIVIQGLQVQTNVQIGTAVKKSEKAARAKSATSRLDAILKSSGLSSDDF